MRAIDTLLAITLTTGVVLSLCVWYWLFLEPIVLAVKRVSAWSASAAVRQADLPSDPGAPGADKATRSEVERVFSR